MDKLHSSLMLVIADILQLSSMEKVMNDIEWLMWMLHRKCAALIQVDKSQ